jgi:REP element-mobilizing transposase RayT
MQNELSSYRPHDPGHDYYAPGVYLITLVVRNRERNHTLLGNLNNDLKAPAVELTEVGRAVAEEWEKIPAFEQAKGRKVKVHGCVCMPDHFHGVIEVLEMMDKSVGQVIWGFKVACTKRWRALLSQPMTAESGQPSLAATPLPDLHLRWRGRVIG